MEKCMNCFFFHKVKLIYTDNGKIDCCLGYCSKNNEDSLLNSEEPACLDFLKMKNSFDEF